MQALAAGSIRCILAKQATTSASAAGSMHAGPGSGLRSICLRLRLCCWMDASSHLHRHTCQSPTLPQYVLRPWQWASFPSTPPPLPPPPPPTPAPPLLDPSPTPTFIPALVPTPAPVPQSLLPHPHTSCCRSTFSSRFQQRLPSRLRKSMRRLPEGGLERRRIRGSARGC